MYDKYESPSTGNLEEELYEKTPMDRVNEAIEKARPLLEKAREKKKEIAVAVVALLVLFFVYDFFIGSVRTVSFGVTDTEGKNIPAGIRVSTESGQVIKSLTSGQRIPLKTGNYRVDFVYPGYKSIRGKTIEVKEEGPIAQEMELDQELELSGEFPETLATGETREIELAIINKESELIESGLVLGGEAKGIMEIDYGKPLALAPGENKVMAKLIVDKEAQAGRTAKALKAIIRIEGLNNPEARIEGKFSLVKFREDKLKITIGNSASKVDFGRVKAGSVVNKTLKVENKNEFGITGLIVEAKIISTEFSNPGELEQWFEFSPSGTMDVGANSSEQATIILKVPVNQFFPPGKETEAIAGAIYVKTGFFEKKFDFTMTVQKAETGVTVTGMQETYNVTRREEIYSPIAGFLDIRNKGDVLLENIAVRVECDYPATDWLRITDTSEFSLEKAETAKIPYTIIVPVETPEGTIGQCKLGVLYTEPSGNRETFEKPIIIRTA